jgi:hypothetical protein
MIRLLPAAAIAAFGIALGAVAKAPAAQDVVFKIWNDTHVPITAIYNKDSRQDNWGWNDLQTVGSGNPFSGSVHPIQPGHYFYIKFAQNSYAHCPTMMQDVKLVFSNGAVKVLRKLEVCKYDVHVNTP